MTELSLVLRAAAFAAQHHRDQRRKGSDKRPYVNHVIEVARILVEEGGVEDPELLAAALLHDVVEDTPVEDAEIRARFGDGVANLVAEATDDKTLAKAERKRQQVVKAPHKTARAKQLKLADKISNVRDLVDAPPDWSDERIQNYGTWAAEVVAGLRGQNAALDSAFDAALASLRAR